MRAFLLIVLFLFYSLYCKADAWTAKAWFPNGSRMSPFSFTIGSQAYVGGGFDVSTGYHDFWQYDPVFDSWIRKTDFPGANCANAVSFSIGNKGYVCTGATETGGASKNLWEYDPETDTWTQKPYFPGTARYFAVAFVIDSVAYVGTGYNGVHNYNDFYAYNKITNSWSAIAPLPDSGGGGAAFSVLSRGYVIGTASRDSSSTTFSRRLWQYDPLTNSWTAKATFPDSGRVCGLSFAIEDKGYYGLGNGDYTDLWQYDPIANTWAQKTSHNSPSSFRQGTSFSIGDKGYVTLGDLTDELLEYSLHGVGVEKVNAPSVAVQVFPNPFATFATITLDRELINGEITLTDLQGNVVAAYTDVHSKTFLLNRNDLPAGIYFCTVKEGNITIATKQIIAR